MVLSIQNQLLLLDFYINTTLSFIDYMSSIILITVHFRKLSCEEIGTTENLNNFSLCFVILAVTINYQINQTAFK